LAVKDNGRRIRHPFTGYWSRDGHLPVSSNTAAGSPTSRGATRSANHPARDGRWTAQETAPQQAHPATQPAAMVRRPVGSPVAQARPLPLPQGSAGRVPHPLRGQGPRSQDFHPRRHRYRLSEDRPAEGSVGGEDREQARLGAPVPSASSSCNQGWDGLGQLDAELDPGSLHRRHASGDLVARGAALARTLLGSAGAADSSKNAPCRLS